MHVSGKQLLSLCFVIVLSVSTTMTLKKIEPTDCGGTVELPLLHYITDGVRLLQRTFAGPLLDLCWAAEAFGYMP